MARPAHSAALLSPGLARRFPFFAPLRTRPEFSLRFGGGQHGEIANDYQSQRALGLDHRSRNLGVLLGSAAGSGGHRRNDTFGFETGIQGSRRADRAEEVHQIPPR